MKLDWFMSLSNDALRREVAAWSACRMPPQRPGWSGWCGSPCCPGWYGCSLCAST